MLVSLHVGDPLSADASATTSQLHKSHRSGRGASSIHLAPWSGHPGFRYRVVSPSEPVLAPDGSLRVVTSRPARGSCTYELLASTSGSAALTPQGHTTARLRGPEKSDCRSSLQTDSADWVQVIDPDNPERVFWFVRDGDAWTTTRDDPSGLRPVDGDRVRVGDTTWTPEGGFITR